jgi:multidrug resistance efflux pump
MIAEKYRQNDTDWNSKFSEASEKIEQMTASINEMTESLSELESLREYKLNTEAAIADAQRADVLSKFTELVGIEEFDQLSGNCSEFTAEELEEKCFAIRGRNIQQLKFSVEPKVSKIKIDKVRPADNDPEPYGDLFVKYGRDK